MGCCGDSRDYDHPKQQQQQQQTRQHHPKQQAHHRPQHYQNQHNAGRARPRPQQQADPGRRQARAHATQAALKYGWAGQQQRPQHDRDSYLEPGLGQALVGMPGSDYRQLAPSAGRQRPPQPAYHRPQQQQQPQRQQQKTPFNRPQQQPQRKQKPSPAAVALPAPPKPAYQSVTAQRKPAPDRYRNSPYRQVATAPSTRPAPVPTRVVHQQPARTQQMQMSADPAQLRRGAQAHQVRVVEPRRDPVAVRRVNSQAASFGYAPSSASFEPAKLVRRDSNGVSEFGDDDDDDLDPASWRRHNVSPGLVSPPMKMNDGLYNHMGMGYGGRGGIF